jgi:hypothetical protein
MQINIDQEPPCNVEHRTEVNAMKKGMKALPSRKSIMIPKLRLSGEVKTIFNITPSTNPQKKTHK